jgi:hypothetical protein
MFLLPLRPRTRVLGPQGGFILNTPLCFLAFAPPRNKLFKRKYTISVESADLLEYKHFNNLPFSFYLTGLIEGDGTIVVPKTEALRASIKGR